MNRRKDSGEAFWAPWSFKISALKSVFNAYIHHLHHHRWSVLIKNLTLPVSGIPLAFHWVLLCWTRLLRLLDCNSCLHIMQAVCLFHTKSREWTTTVSLKAVVFHFRPLIYFIIINWIKTVTSMTIRCVIIHTFNGWARMTDKKREMQ